MSHGASDHSRGDITKNTINGAGSKRPKKEIASDQIQAFRSFITDADDEDKKLFIKELLMECTLSQLEHVSAFISQLRVVQCRIPFDGQCDPFSIIPTPIVLKILGFLDPISLCNCARVCRRWRRVCVEPSIWKALCHRPREYRMCSVSAERAQLAKYTQGGTVRWKDAFSERFRLWSNWHAGRCAVRTFTGHTQGVSCVQFDEHRIVSGSTDTTIRLWEIKGEKEGVGSMTLNGHSSTVRCLHLVGQKLASGSNDFSIKVWDLDMNTQWSAIACRKTMLGHTNYVRCLEMAKNHLISGSYDKTLKLWSLETGECVRTLHGHGDAVLCEQYTEEESRAVSGSVDMSIKTWDTRIGQPAMTIHHAHDSAVTCVRADECRIVSGSLDRMIKMWDTRTGKCLQTIDWRRAEGHTGVVRCLQVDSWRIVSSADDRTIKVWNVETGNRLCTLRDHSDGVTCVQFNDYQIVSGSYDKTVKLWDFGVC